MPNRASTAAERPALTSHGSMRHDRDTDLLRAAILAGILEQFVRDPSPRSAAEVVVDALERHGVTEEVAGFAIRLALDTLVQARLLGTDRVNPDLGTVDFKVNPQIVGTVHLTIYRGVEIPPAVKQ